MPPSPRDASSSRGKQSVMDPRHEGDTGAQPGRTHPCEWQSPRYVLRWREGDLQMDTAYYYATRG
ncbi:hypothetical protein GCM10020219_011840 [Nonomuraea dietziae]